MFGWKFIRTAALVACATPALSACDHFTKFHDDYQVNPILTNTAAKKDGQGGPLLAEGEKRPNIIAFNLDNGKLPAKGSANEGGEGCSYAVATESQACRNRLQDYLLGLSDQACAIHRGEIVSAAAQVDLGFSGLTTVLGGVGALVTGETASRALAGSAGMVSGLHTNVRSTVYQNMLVGAILHKIDEQRKEIYRNIVQKQDKLPTVYTAEAMLRDVVDYHDKCAFYSGVSTLVRGDSAPANADQIRGKIASLRREIAETNKFIADNPGDPNIANYRTANERMSRAVAHLSGQLSVVELGPNGDGVIVKEDTPSK